MEMRKFNFVLLSSLAVLFMMLAVSSVSAKSDFAEELAQLKARVARAEMRSQIAMAQLRMFKAKEHIQSRKVDDRDQLEDLQARYLWALDFDDVDLFASLFTEDATFIVKGDNGTLVGRDAIYQSTYDRLQEKLANLDPNEEWHAASRHYVTNMILKIDGNKAIGRSYWCNANNRDDRTKGTFGTFGHYEDEFVKKNGKWLFSYRKVVYETRDGLYSTGGNPAW